MILLEAIGPRLGELTFLIIIVMAFWPLIFLTSFMPGAVFMLWLDGKNPRLAARLLGMKLDENGNVIKKEEDGE